jgi:hypothetical protein
MALLTEMYSTTRTNRDMPLADNVTNHNAFLRTMDEKGMIKNANGGRDLTEPLLYGEYSNAKWYDGYETFTVDTSEEVVTAAVYDWKQLGGFTFISGKEEHQNTGKHAAVDLVTAKDEGLIATLRNKAAIALYNDGVTDPKAWGGLQYLVQDVPSGVGTVAGIDQVAEAWWRNQTSGDLTIPTVGGWAAIIQSAMNAMYLATIRGTDKVDLILADLNTFTGYWESLQANQRLISVAMGEAGFHALEFMGSPCVYDTACPADHMYFINSDFLRMRKAPGRWFSDEAPQVIQSADYTLFPNWTMSNLTCNNRARQGVIFGTAE